METVCVMGLGYIGLPTASLLATKGFKVHGVDVSQLAVDTINSGGIHIYEPDLDILVKAAVQSGNLKADFIPVCSDIFILAVPTPFIDNHMPDITYIETAAKTIAPYLKPQNLIILESTSPVGTTEKIAGWIRELRPDLTVPIWDTLALDSTEQENRIYISHCPERVLPGQILKELIGNDRIIGGIDRTSAIITKKFYEKFVKGEIIPTDSRTAELSKLVENSFRDVNIAFANELSLICDDLSVNVWELIDLANRHPRVNILQPGPGVGGHCIAVDPWFIVASTPDKARLIKTAREINDGKPEYIITKIKEKAARIKNPVIACLGLAFKADIDDLRESPAVKIVEQLVEDDVGRLLIVEPHINELPLNLRKENIELVELRTAILNADVIVLLVNHRAFSGVGNGILKEKIVIDTRGMWQ